MFCTWRPTTKHTLGSEYTFVYSEPNVCFVHGRHGSLPCHDDEEDDDDHVDDGDDDDYDDDDDDDVDDGDDDDVHVYVLHIFPPVACLVRLKKSLFKDN